MAPQQGRITVSERAWHGLGKKGQDQIERHYCPFLSNYQHDFMSFYLIVSTVTATVRVTVTVARLLCVT
jgi:hypothetical protein